MPIEVPLEVSLEIIGWIVWTACQGFMLIAMIQGISTRHNPPAYNELQGWGLFTVGLVMFIVLNVLVLYIYEVFIFV